MNKKVPLSVVITAYNEEKKIKDCLDSVKWADEIIVIDNSSIDKTKSIVEQFTSKIFTKPNNPMLNVNKNYGFTKAKHKWILSLDPDERVSEELAEEIKNVVAGENNNGYYIPRKNIIFGKWIEHTGWYPDHQLRLFKKDCGKFEEIQVHEMLKVDGNVGYLNNPLIHYTFDNISQFLQKHIIVYAPNEAAVLIEKGYEFNYMDAIRFPLNEFLSRYFAREGYKDGFYGLILSLLMSFYHIVIFTLIWEKNKYLDKEENVFDKFKSEVNKSDRQINFWFYSVMRNETKSMSRKIYYRLRLKF